MSSNSSSDHRAPLGERDENERSAPFGARPRRRSGQSEQDETVSPYAPYRSRRESPSTDSFIAPPSDAEPTTPDGATVIEGTGGVILTNRPRKRATPEPDPLISPELDEDDDDDDLLEEDAPPQPESMLRDLRQRRREVRTRLEESAAQQAAARPDGEPITLRPWIILRSTVALLIVAAIVATLFTWWTPNEFLPEETLSQLAVAQATQANLTINPAIAAMTPTPSPLPVAAPRIGIVSGHKGLNPASGLPDPGAVCPDGLTEQEINESVALLVAAQLEAEGYQVDLFDEFDPRLQGYSGLALVSIHADSCDYINDIATGFKVASFQGSQISTEDELLVRCMINRYAQVTGLPLHPSITADMTAYHNFREVDPATPSAIIEIGFMYLDREFLTQRPDVAADGVTRGLLCFLNGEISTGAAAEPTPTRIP
ncbi:MAG: N-acetylmuramoyl-L-alanine amidase [Chloroflexi bacterium]|nr:N-acetylmuramoyl-L-alanine amidase [Chloroflexota bacterium]